MSQLSLTAMRRKLVLLLIAAQPAVLWAQSGHYSVLCNFVRQEASSTPSSFTAIPNIPNHTVSAVQVAKESSPKRIFILNDISGSMGEGNAREFTLRAVRDFAQSSSSTDQMALVNFNRQPYLDIDLRSPSDFLKALDEPKVRKDMKPEGGTALFDAMLASIRYLTKKPQPGDSLFLISDGLDNSSATRIAQLRGELLKSDVRVFMLALESPAFSRAQQQDRAALFDAVAQSGGAVLPAPALNDLLLQKPPLSGHVQPVFDSSAKGISKTQDLMATARVLIEQPQRISFEVSPPIIKQEKLTINLGGDTQGKGSVRILCPSVLNPN